MCGGHRPEAIAQHIRERLRNFSLSSLWKKEWQRNTELTAVEFEPGTAWSEITELPTKPRGSWRVHLIEKAIRLWYVSFFVLCCRHALFATSMFERASLLLFSMLTREFVLFQEIVLFVHGDVSRRMICRKKTFTNSLVEATASENDRKSLL